MCVLNHLFVNEGNEPQFESKFLKRTKYLQDVPGFKTLRFYVLKLSIVIILF